MKTGTGALGLVLVCGLLLSGCSALGLPDLEREAAVKASNRLIYRGGPYTEDELQRMEVFSPQYAARHRMSQAVSELQRELGPINRGEKIASVESDVQIEQHYKDFINKAVLSGDQKKMDEAKAIAQAVADVYGHKIPFLKENQAPVSVDDTEKQQTLTMPEAQRTPAQNHDTGKKVKPNAYGLGVNADQYGRSHIYRLKDGTPLSPIFQDGVKRDVYGPGVHQDQFGRPVYDSRP